MMLAMILVVCLARNVCATCEDTPVIAAHMNDYCVNQSPLSLTRNLDGLPHGAAMESQITTHRTNRADVLICREIEKEIAKVHADFGERVKNLTAELTQRQQEYSTARKERRKQVKNLKRKLREIEREQLNITWNLLEASQTPRPNLIIESTSRWLQHDNTSSCPGFQYDDYCFWCVFRQEKDINYTEAKEICRDGNSTLANIYSEEHYNQTVRYMRSHGSETNLSYLLAWIGMTRDGLSTRLTHGLHAPYDVKAVNPSRWKKIFPLRLVYMFTWADEMMDGYEKGLGRAKPSNLMNAVLCQSLNTDCPGFMHDGRCFWAVIENSLAINLEQGKFYCNHDGRSRIANIYSKSHYEKMETYLTSRKGETEYTFLAIWTGMTRDIPSGVTRMSDGQIAPYVGKVQRRSGWRTDDRRRTNVYIFVATAKRSRGSEGFGNTWPRDKNNAVLCQFP